MEKVKPWAPVYVLEGCDNTGKTTYALDLCEREKATYVKTYYKDWSIEQLNRFQDQFFCHGSEVPTVLDRVPIISHYIYNNVIRGDNSYTLDQVVFFVKDWFIYSRGKVNLIYFRPDTQTVKTFDDRPQMKGVIENVEKLLFAYDRLFDVFRSEDIPFTVHDWSKHHV